MSDGITTTILGQKSTGKTCYLVALYNMMMAGVDIGGTQLSLSMPTEKIAEENYLRLQYKALKEQSRFPLPTDEKIHEYSFFLCKDLKERFEFTWVDYTGELLELGGHLNAESHKFVMDRLKKDSTSVLFPLKGEIFAQPIPTDKWKLSAFKRDNGYDTFNKLIAEYIDSMPEYTLEFDDRHKLRIRKTPVIVLLITMYDKCEKRDFNEIVSEIQQLFPPLFKYDERKPCITGIIPVSLGSEENSGKFKVDPFQVHLPLIFLLLKELEVNAKIVKDIESVSKSFVYQEASTFWGGIRTFFDINKEQLEGAKMLIQGCGSFKEFFGPFEKVFTDTLKEGENKLVYFDRVRHNIGMGDSK